MTRERIRAMEAPRKYPDELRERATRMAVEARRDPATRAGAIQRTGHQLGVHPEALRGWVKRAEIDDGARAGTSSVDAGASLNSNARFVSCGKPTRSCAPRARCSPRRRSTADWGDRGLPGSVSRPVRGRLDQSRADRAPPADRPVHLLRGQAAGHSLRGRAGRGLRREPGIRPMGGQRRVYGVRKLWHAARRAAHTCGRDQVGRLMRLAGITGAVRGRHTTKTTYRDHAASRHPDLIERAWSTPERPDRWWVADFTYCWTLNRFCCTAFCVDVHSRRILGWRVMSSKTTPTADLGLG